MDKLIILQTAIPDYRSGFFSVIREVLDEKFVLYGGSNYFEASVKTAQQIPHKNIENKYLFGRRFLWQKGVMHLASQRAVLVLEMNPRILSNWVLLLSRKRKKLPTVLWGHAWPRDGQYSKTDKLRHQMRKLATRIIVYTKKQALELKQKMPNKNIAPAPNALFFREDMTPAHSKTVNDIIYVGRLTEGKKPFFLVRAFKELMAVLPQESKLLIVGDGEEKTRLEEFIATEELDERIKILGHISDFHKLKALYATSIFSVSPGYVGLSITQSFAFGVPMLISREEPHSPEIEAALEGKNAIFYDTDDMESFCKKVNQIIENRTVWIEKRAEISRYCRENYTVEAMAQVFINLIAKDDI